MGARPLLARVLIERGRRHDDAASLAEARDIYSDLRAERWLTTLDWNVEWPAA